MSCRGMYIVLLICTSLCSARAQNLSTSKDMKPDACLSFTSGDVVRIRFQTSEAQQLPQYGGYGQALFSPGPGIPEKYMLKIGGVGLTLPGYPRLSEFAGVVPDDAIGGEYLLRSLRIQFASSKSSEVYAEASFSDSQLAHSSSALRICVKANAKLRRKRRLVSLDNLTIVK